jgi:hypothetical protein
MYKITKEEITQAIKSGKIKDKKSLIAFVSSRELEDQLDLLKKITIRGEKGDKGDDGYTPVKGVDYFDGKDGKEGVQGPAGPKGESKTGERGPAGPQGEKGESIVGPAGPSGLDGKDGSPDTGEQIIEKINGVKDGLKKLKIEYPKKVITQDILDRAISILDQRTQFLINKVSNLATVGVGGSAVYRNDGTISGTTITMTRNATTVLSLVINGQFIHTFTHTSGTDTIEITSDEATGFNGNDYTVIFV